MVDRSYSTPSCRGATALAACLLLVVASCHRRAAEGSPNLLFIVIDTLRADHCTDYGYDQNTTPNLHALAERSVLFERVIAPSSWTKTSMASIMTARDPLRTGVRGVEDVLPAGLTTFAGSLRELGYFTIGVNTNPWLKEKFGFAAGFDVYETTAVEWPYVRAGEANRLALKLLEEHADEGPTFLYLHLMDVHAPCTPEPPFYSGEPLTLPGLGAVTDKGIDFLYRKRGLDDPVARQRVIELYDGEIRTVDAAIADLLGALDRSGWTENSILVLTSDHGEAFREHGTPEHGKNLYPEVLEIPLIVHGPRYVPQGIRIGVQVRGIDIAPTVLALVGGELPASFDGEPLLPMREDVLDDRIAITAVGGNDSVPDLDYVGVVSSEYLYVHERTHDVVEFYDLRTDPGAHEDLGRLHPEAGRFARLLQGLEELDPERIELDPETIEQLKSLGYLH